MSSIYDVQSGSTNTWTNKKKLFVLREGESMCSLSFLSGGAGQAVMMLHFGASMLLSVRLPQLTSAIRSQLNLAKLLRKTVAITIVRPTAFGRVLFRRQVLIEA